MDFIETGCKDGTLAKNEKITSTFTLRDLDLEQNSFLHGNKDFKKKTNQLTDTIFWQT